MAEPLPSPPRIAVLLAVHNGLVWLPEQLASILGQTGVAVSVFCSVDAS
jgi:rhamnosyltransferase